MQTGRTWGLMANVVILLNNHVVRQTLTSSMSSRNTYKDYCKQPSVTHHKRWTSPSDTSLPKQTITSTMPSYFTIHTLTGLLTIGAIAQESPMKMCNSEKCDYSPSSITTAGTGYPACVVYDRDTVLGGKAGDFDPVVGGTRMFYNIAPTAGDCQTM
jgi:hypothetical protein